MDLNIIIPLLGVVLGWLGFLEKRLRDTMNDTKERIETANRLNDAIQSNLKEDIHRLEGKIDQLIQFNYQLMRTSLGNRNAQD